MQREKAIQIAIGSRNWNERQWSKRHTDNECPGDFQVPYSKLFTFFYKADLDFHRRTILPEGLEIIIEPYKRVVIHEVIEYRLADMVGMMISQASAAGGTTILMINWCNGIVFQIAPFNPNSDEVISEQLKGIIHYAAVTFATKERFEREVRTNDGTVRLVDQSANSNFVKLAEVLKAKAQYHS